MIVPLPLIEESFVFTGCITAMGCVTAIVSQWIKSRAPRGGVSRDVLQRLDEMTDRMGRLDTAVDAIAVEIERISEGQRFTTKLLAERAAPAIAPPLSAAQERPRAAGPGGSTTPH